MPSKPKAKAKETDVELTPKQEQFCIEYLIDLNGTQAAVRAGYSEKTASEQAARLLANVRVQTRVADLQAQRAKRTEITADKVLNRWWDIANADPSELIQLQRIPCRHCHGKGHKYQFTPAEWAVRLASDEKADKQGGIGYDHKKEPHPDCPECSGLGLQSVQALDTRKLTGPAKLLYAGVKQSKEGFEIKMQDQAKALENVARHLGMFIERVEVQDTTPVKTVYLPQGFVDPQVGDA